MNPVILVAEDEDNDFSLFHRAFLKLGQKTSLLRVRNGVEAVDYLEGTNGFQDRAQFPFPDLVMLDLKMPGKDGHEVLRWIREHPRFKSLIVIILTSSDDPGDIERAYALGANSYVMKPSAYTELVELTHVLTTYWLRWAQRPELTLPRVSEAILA